MSSPPEEWDELVRQHWTEVFGLLVAATGNRALAEELAQEVWLTAWRRGVRAGPGARTWFRRAARYVALNANRKPRPLSLDPKVLCQWVDARTDDRDGEMESTFESSLVHLRCCLKELPEPDRKLLSDFYEKEQSIATLAQACGQSPGYVKQRLFRIRTALRACVERRRKGT